MILLLASAAVACVSLLEPQGPRTLIHLEETRGAAYWAVAPKAWRAGLVALLSRRASEGLSVAILPVELFSARSGPDLSQAIRDFFREGSRNWKEKPRFLLLAAGTQAGGIPTFLRDWSTEDVKALDSLPTKSYRNVASDLPFAQMDDDMLPDLAVGRLPARSEEELRFMVGKILAYEAAGPGLWRRRVLLLGGLFGEPRVDAVVEAAVGGLLDRELPCDFDLRVIRAEPQSPYGVGIEKTRSFFTRQMEEGALISIYAGHANPDEFSTPVPGRRAWEPLFKIEDARNMKSVRGAPVMMSFACHAGGIAAGNETIADTAMRNPHGPIAYFGASGISAPMPDLILAHEMTRLFRERKDLRLGELVLEAKRAAMTNDDEFHRQVAAGSALFGFTPEKQAHLLRFELWIYNLHGDPALRLQRPAGQIALSSRVLGSAESVEVEGAIEGWDEGDALVSLEMPRSTPVPRDMSWKEANDKALVRAGAEIRGGRFRVRLETGGGIPPGNYNIKAYASAGGQDASGCLRIEIPN